jgi:predicted O-methyltransferase YrrM
MNKIIINKDPYFCNSSDFQQLPHDEYNNLIILPKVGELERLVGLVNDLSEIVKNPTLLHLGVSYSSFFSINCSKHFNQVYIDQVYPETDLTEVSLNVSNYSNISLLDHEITENTIIKVANSVFINIKHLTNITKYKPLILSRELTILESQYPYKFKLTNSDQVLYVHNNYFSKFMNEFHYYIKDNIFDYDNLIHLCIMVKNGGDLFEKVLIENIQWIDRWTILDTGSTDNTIEIINRVLVGKKKGKLYQEPFINFRESRNRCLELCETNCKYNVMLDDTYIIQGEFRDFLNTVRGDQFADSYSLLVKSDDTEYYSNRVTKSKNKLRYIYTIHEVIQKDDNVNVVIPAQKSWIFDLRAPYMEKRTMERKQYDLKCLFDMVKEYPNDPRHLYYIAQTYNLLEDYEKAAEYFYKRAFHPVEGFDQEKIDALFEMTRTYQYKLNKPWEECEKYYELVSELDPERPEGFYFRGIHYYLEGNHLKAFELFKQAYKVGFPVHRQYSLKPTLSYHFLPKFLSELCYQFKDFKLGEECSKLFLDKNKPTEDYYNIMKNWYGIFSFLNKMAPINKLPVIPEKPIFCFVADGGFTKWSGKNILTTGVGGSETYIIELARYIKQLSNYTVIVYCNCEENEVFEGVIYSHINNFFTDVSTIYIQHCFISRYSEYVPVAIEGHVENIHVVLHDLGLTGDIIPMNPKLKNIFCLTEWHKQLFLQTFPQFVNKTHAFHYGIDFTNFMIKDEKKIPKSFIYSSTANRGLLTILKMWPKIQERYPDATFNIFTDVYNNWANTFYPEELEEIRKLLFETYSDNSNIKLHGWVDKKTLANYWKTSDIWFYPCKFQETFCLTALEAALTKTFVISNDLAALQNTVGDRGEVIKGNAMTEDWQNKAFEKICLYFDNIDYQQKAHDLIQKNYEWALTHSWKDRAIELLKTYIDIYSSNNKNQFTNLHKNIVEDEVKKLDYADMYNWIQDLPSGSKIIFESVLEDFIDKKCRILEIGTYAGTSAIAMLKYLPDSTATVIDAWKNYSEKNSKNEEISYLKNIEELNIFKVFEQNVIKSNTLDRITAFKGDSLDILLNMQNKTEFDFIYVDGSHRCMDCYTDCLLSWKLLSKGGIMAIDDYLYNINKEQDIFEIPYEGINQFLEKIKDQYILLNKGYRVFIKKL